MNDKIRLKLIVTVEYDASPRYYGTNDPAKMAAIDEDNFNEDPNSLFEFLMNRDYLIIEVEPA